METSPIKSIFHNAYFVNVLICLLFAAIVYLGVGLFGFWDMWWLLLIGAFVGAISDLCSLVLVKLSVKWIIIIAVVLAIIMYVGYVWAYFGNFNTPFAVSAKPFYIISLVLVEPFGFSLFLKLKK